MNKIESCLLDVGVPANIHGFGYLCDAIQLVTDDKSLMNQVTKRLYPEVAKKNETTGNRVERSIRHAIEVAFNSADYTTVSKYFGNAASAKSGKLTNSQFIAGLALYLRDDLKVDQKTE